MPPHYARGIVYGGSLLALGYAGWAIAGRLFPALGDGTAIAAEFGLSVYEIPFLACGLLGLLKYARLDHISGIGIPIAFLLLAAVSVFSAWVMSGSGGALERGIPIIIISTPLCIGVLVYLLWRLR